jgi:hypothetical protein
MTTIQYDDAKRADEAPDIQTIALEVLTDEEVSVLVPDQGVVVAPVLDAVPAEQREAVRRTAFRGLVARGIVAPPDAGTVAAVDTQSTASVDLQVRNDVLSALTLRRSASAVLAVARTTASGQDFWYAHVVEEVVLLEEVGSDGLHRFALGHARDLADLLVGAVVHPDAADAVVEDAEDGEVELAVAPDSEAPAELVERLGAAYLRADALVVTREAGAPVERPDLTGLFTGPEGSWSVVAKPGSQRAWARPETVASITRRVRDLAAHALAAPPRREGSS